ncbi:MAG: transglycosylase domain-containing protein [Paludibacter sp.]|nr:transglycosylase domain-containing protein [Paludibacter sp.]
MWDKLVSLLRNLAAFLQKKMPVIWELIKKRWFQFIEWRKKRLARFKTLPWYSRLVNIVVTGTILFLFFLFLVDINFLWLFGKSPGLRSIGNPNQNEASLIISADNQVIGKYYTENRIPVEFEEISPKLIETLIYTEDQRFYKNFGIDFHGVFAAMKDVLKGNPRGASTITQQLVKNMYKTRNQYSRGLLGQIPGLRLIIMKMKEWITAVKIELFYSKEEILTKYLNTVDFGSNSFGIYTAAKTYFRSKPSELNYEQSATLIGLLKATTYYSPIQNPEQSKKRRNVVLQNLVEHGVFSQEVCDSLKNIPIRLNYEREENYDGIALHFRAYLAKYLEDWEKQSGHDIYADGLKIHVALDSRLQHYAEEAVEKQMKAVQRRFFDHWRGQNPWRDENKVEIQDFVENIARKTKSYSALQRKFGENEDSIFHYLNIPRKTKVFDYKTGAKDTTLSVMDSIRYMNHFMHTGFVAMEPNTGEVKAWVGDINFNFWQYDKVAQSKRQPGSTFKLFVYTAAMMHGLAPCDYRTDQPVKWDYMENGEPKSWQPNNVDYTYRGNVTLKYAFAKSINTIAVQLAKEVGIEAVIQTAHLLGIKTKLEDKPSTSLGASDVSLLELVNSFGTVVNEGIHNEPVLVTRIEDADGHVIYKADNQSKRVIPYETAWLMTEMLKGGMTEPGGTTQALWEWDIFNYNTNFGGKTGTSSNHSDAWFVGVTKNLIGGAWVGGEQRSVHFRTGQLGEGSRTALPIFGLFMEKVLKDEHFKHYRGKFPEKPKETITRKYKCHTYIPVDTTSVDTTQTTTSAPEETEVMPVEN